MSASFQSFVFTLRPAMPTPRVVTEQDFRMPEFRDANPADYEFRADGKLVRKDRWERAVMSICSEVGLNIRAFEVDEVVEAVEKLVAEHNHRWHDVIDEDMPSVDCSIEVLLDDGSVLRDVAYVRNVGRGQRGHTLTWNGAPVPRTVTGWRDSPLEEEIAAVPSAE